MKTKLKKYQNISYSLDKLGITIQKLQRYSVNNYKFLYQNIRYHKYNGYEIIKEALTPIIEAEDKHEIIKYEKEEEVIEKIDSDEEIVDFSLSTGDIKKLMETQAIKDLMMKIVMQYDNVPESSLYRNRYYTENFQRWVKKSVGRYKGEEKNI